MDFGREELVERLVAGDILTAPINDIADVVGDPQILHNEMIVATDHAKLGRVDVTGVPIKFHGTPGGVRLAPPMLGQHTEEILGELGYGTSDVESLAAQGIVGTRASIEAAKAG
jgi:crotonobetainyl-CoA:carnitine CoA-transferase CaiB-like acyl-CoA transferase